MGANCPAPSWPFRATGVWGELDTWERSRAGMAGLAYAMRGLPLGTVYAVWVGIGAALNAGYAMWSGQEPVSVLRAFLLLGIVGRVLGLAITQ